MKKSIITLIFLGVLSATFGRDVSLKAYLSHASFYAPGHGPFLETYLSILGRSINFVKNENGKFQGTVKVTMLFKQNDSIKEFRKYNLLTTELTDTTQIDFMVFDQQRIGLPAGEYTIELEIADMHSAMKPFKAQDKLKVNYTDKKISVSDMEFVESYTEAAENSSMAKSGYDLIPYQDYFFPESKKKITFYAEIYNSAAMLGKETQFVVTSSIQSAETGIPVENFFRIKRETASDVNVIFNEFEISELPSGNYNIVISVRDKENNEITSKRMFIQRSNPGIKFNINKLQNVEIGNSFVARITQPDSLSEFIRMCRPISSSIEKMFIDYNVSTGTLLNKQQFFYNFWSQRNSVDPESAWLTYYNTVLAVNREFGSTQKKGYETDRGRVYLQYGSPNERIRETMNPDSYPYEIWHYYQIANQSNQRFVFYTRDVALNDYVVLHSTVLGEIKNVTWQYDIKRSQHDKRPRDTDNQLFKSPYEEEQFGEHTGEYFNIRK